MDIIERIIELRKRKGFTQSLMAEKLGIAPNNYGKIEKGITEMTVNRLNQIAEILSISVVELLVGEPQTMQSDERVKELEKRVEELEDRVKDKEELIRVHRFTKQTLGETTEVHIWVLIEEFAESNGIGTKKEKKSSEFPMWVDLTDNQIEEIFTYLMEEIDKDGFLKAVFELNIITDTRLSRLFKNYFNSDKYKAKQGGYPINVISFGYHPKKLNEAQEE